MRTPLLFLFSALATVALPSDQSHARYVHERRSSTPPLWSTPTTPDPSTPIPFRIALTQSNLHVAHDELMRVSDPSSPDFAKHWTAKEVGEFFAPSAESVEAVRTWLEEEGISWSRVKQTQSLGWLEVGNMTVTEAETLLGAEYAVYTHEPTGHRHLACREYSIPKHISSHVDFITPTVHFDARIPKASRSDVGRRTAASVGRPSSGWLPKEGAKLSSSNIFNDLANCSEQIVPICLQALYNLPIDQLQYASAENSYGIVEYTTQSYLATDLDLFFEQFLGNAVGRRPVLDSIDGGIVSTEGLGFSQNGESDLDLQYSMALVYPLTPVLYQTGDAVEGGSFNTFLDALDASYCTYEGGDDFSDPVYPDPYGGYTGPENCGGFSAAHVISTSYGYDEVDLTPSYEMRQCNEYLKLGLQGTTVLFSSGDYGVAGNNDVCHTPRGEYSSCGTLFNPSFPSTCPYVTAVGATQIKPGASVWEAEEACETVIYSGGGFSNVFSLPSYQESAIEQYYASYPPPYNSTQYNNSRAVRGFPDISANGANYVVAIDGVFSLVFGTSASSPVVGSLITLVNDARLSQGKRPVGFLNPALYANPWLMNDITVGNNPGCCTPGFTAVPGWDPVTGLGTPDYINLVAYYLTLP